MDGAGARLARDSHTGRMAGACRSHGTDGLLRFREPFDFLRSCPDEIRNLKRLELRPSVKTPADLNAYFNTAFQRAIDESGDYETIFYPSEKDWAGPLIFQHPDSVDAWRSVLANLKPFNFKEIRTDVLGGIFK